MLFTNGPIRTFDMLNDPHVFSISKMKQRRVSKFIMLYVQTAEVDGSNTRNN